MSVSYLGIFLVPEEGIWTAKIYPDLCSWTTKVDWFLQVHGQRQCQASVLPRGCILHAIPGDLLLKGFFLARSEMSPLLDFGEASFCPSS